MYYAEKLIGNMWHWRGTPDGKWIPMSITQLNDKINSLIAELAAERKCRTELEKQSEEVW